MLTEGDKVHVVIRRIFEKDIRRHFLGQVSAVAGQYIQLEGYSFQLDTTKGEFAKSPHPSERIISLIDSGNIITILPDDSNLADADYEMSVDNRMVLTDNGSLYLDINEFGSRF